MHSLKSFTANEANKFLGRTGKFWQRESYDHWVRGHAELTRIAEYIANNAVSANLVQNACEWPFCSSYDRIHPREKSLAVWW
jgi:putative DNA methylase